MLGQTHSKVPYSIILFILVILVFPTRTQSAEWSVRTISVWMWFSLLSMHWIDSKDSVTNSCDKWAARFAAGVKIGAKHLYLVDCYYNDCKLFRVLRWRIFYPFLALYWKISHVTFAQLSMVATDLSREVTYVIFPYHGRFIPET